MNYDDVIAAVFQPSPAGVAAGSSTHDTPARRLRDAIEPLAMHSVWSRTTNEAQAALGLDFMTGYVMGRAALMGRPTSGVVAAAFAVFEPAMVGGAYEAAVAVCDRDELWAVRTDSTIASLAEVLNGVDDVRITEVGTILREAIAELAPVGRPLFGGLSTQPWPEDPTGVLWRACELMREHRGDSHVAACVAAGLDPIEMNILTERWVGMPLGSYSGSRAWAPEAITSTADSMRAKGWLDGDDLSTAGLALRTSIEDTTDRLQQPLIDTLGGALEPAITNLEAWSQRCIDAGAFPPDVFKRAAG